MKRIFALFAGLALSGTAHAVSPLFFNAGVITNAIQIDATTFLNQGTFTNISSPDFPYSMKNVRFFTNRGVMSGSVGFQIDTVLSSGNPPRRPLASFYNANGASISGVDNSFGVFGFFGGSFISTSSGTASFVKVAATNLVNRGNLSVGQVGLMQLTGKNVDLARGSLIAGQAANSDTNFFLDNFNLGSTSRGFFIGNQFVNAYGVEDLYFGAGTVTLNLESGANFGYFPPDGVFSPAAPVRFRSSSRGSFIGGNGSVPQTFPAEFAAFANVEQFGTNIEIQVVFVKTNFMDTNIIATVRFTPIGQVANTPPINQFGQSAIVEFSTPELDPISGRVVTNAIYFIDSSAEQQSIVLLTNALSINSSSRPSGYEITTSTPFEWLFASEPNEDYTDDLIYPGDTYKDKNVTAFYGAYGAQVGRNPESLAGTSFSTNSFFNVGLGNTFLLLPDPTNQPGRIEIKADTLDLTQTRIRTDGLLSIDAKHVKGGGAADISAGIINADMGTTNGFMVISNIFPSHFRRVRGDLFAWSAIWDNTETNDFVTNNVHFHVLILDHELRAEFKPTARNFTLRSKNLSINDTITINKSLKLFTENLTIGGTITVAEQGINVDSGNFIGVKDFLVLSNGVFQGANVAYFGFDVPGGWDSITNRGLISAVAPFFKAKEFENSGTIRTTNGGTVSIEADVVNLSNGRILSDRDIEITAGELIATNSTLVAGQRNSVGALQIGRLVLNVTDSIIDFGLTSTNLWEVSDGFVLSRKPSEGDLLGTQIRTISSGFQEVQHIWPGQDVGAGPDGYDNNLALNRLTLDVRSASSRLRFTGADSDNALYVVNLDLVVSTNVDVNTPLQNLITIDDNIRIYFINSSVGDKLTNAFPDRVIQVADFGLSRGISPIVVKARGLGVITPNLDGKNLKIGSDYKMKATAGKGHVFAGWTGGLKASSRLLKFKMRPNLSLEANFIPNPFEAVKGSYSGLFYEPTNGIAGRQHETSGSIELKVTPKGVFTGKLTLGKAYRFAGKFDGAGFAEIQVKRAKASALNLKLQLDLGVGADQVAGSVAGDDWTTPFVGHRAGLGSVEKGAYTMAILSGSSPDSPAGDGVATITVSDSGGIRVKGALSDGTKIDQQTTISKNGEWPFYVPLYKGDGSIMGLINFSNQPATLSGDLSWIKKGGPLPFTNITSVLGSFYLPPAKGASVIVPSSGVITLREGNLTEWITNLFELGHGNALSITGTNDLRISVNAPSGLLNGSFFHPDARKATQVKGVVLQQQNNARGFFLGPNESGAFLLEGN